MSRVFPKQRPRALTLCLGISHSPSTLTLCFGKPRDAASASASTCSCLVIMFFTVMPFSLFVVFQHSSCFSSSSHLLHPTVLLGHAQGLGWRFRPVQVLRKTVRGEEPGQADPQAARGRGRDRRGRQGRGGQGGQWRRRQGCRQGKSSPCSLTAVCLDFPRTHARTRSFPPRFGECFVLALIRDDVERLLNTK